MTSARAPGATAARASGWRRAAAAWGAGLLAAAAWFFPGPGAIGAAHAAGPQRAAPADPGVTAASPPPHATGAAAAGPAAAPSRRPRIGLVLSGGGARGLAHVGVLKVLERERIPVDVIAGTSMGSIIGGLYAAGMDATELERELRGVAWGELFASRVDRRELSQRRKEQDYDVSPLVELGMRDGELRTQVSAVSSRGLELLLRRYALPVRAAPGFDALPTPFRAVATDMERGTPVVLSDGDLAQAMRSSMSVPGLFAPTEVDGRILGDGGLVDNLPVDVARAMGADVIIAVNIGTPLAGRESLGSLLGVTSQMINILTEQNVRSSLRSLGPRDVLVSPDLGPLTSGDFDRVQEFIARGERGANFVVERLVALALDEAGYAAWRAARLARLPAAATAPLAAVEFEGSKLTSPQRLGPELASQPGARFDVADAEADARRLAASGDYVRADYRLVPGPGGDRLVFDLEDKSWGPHYFRIGLDMNSDFRGDSGFNVKISHDRRWLTPGGTEWRNYMQIGGVPRLATELYHPLQWTIGPSNDWFVAGWFDVERRGLILYRSDEAVELARFRRTGLRGGVDLGQPWGALGELRLGLDWQRIRLRPQSISAEIVQLYRSSVVEELGLRARVAIDQLDHTSFPQRGWRLTAEASAGQGRGGGDDEFSRLSADSTYVASRGVHTLNLHAAVQMTTADEQSRVGRYALGGFHNLSGYAEGQLVGNAVLLMRAGWYMRLNDASTLTRGFFLGATLEAGEAWFSRRDMRAGDLRTGMSIYLGADTGIGPLYLGLTHAPRGATGVSLVIGRP